MLETVMTVMLVGNLVLASVMYVVAYKNGYKDGVTDTNTPF